MYRILLFVFFCGFYLSIGAQTHNEAWRDNLLIQGANANNSFYKLVKSPDGNMIAAGQFDGDILIAKVDVAGTMLWKTIIQGTATGNDVVGDLVISQGGFIYVCGSEINAVSSNDIVTACLDLNGNVFWKQDYNGSGNGSDFGQSITVDLAGNAFVCGMENSIAGNTDGVILSYSITGSLNWVSINVGSGNGNDEYYSITNDNNGKVYAAGYELNLSSGTDAVLKCLTISGNTQWTYLDSTSASETYKKIIYDQGHLFVAAQFGGMKIIKFDTAGNLNWSFNTNISTCNSISLDPSGRIIGVGHSFVSTNTRIQVAAVTTSGALDFLTTDPAGTYVGDDKPTGVSTDSLGNIFVTGWRQTSAFIYSQLLLKMSSSGSVAWNKTRTGNATGFLIQTSAGMAIFPGRIITSGVITNLGTKDDATITEYDYSGNLLSAFAYDWSHGDTRAPLLADDGNGNIIVAASSYAPSGIVLAKFSPAGILLWADSMLMPSPITSINTTALSIDSAGNIFVGAIAATSVASNQDLWVGKFTSTGDSIWTRRYTSPGNHQETCYGIACGENGSVYACGILWDGTYNAAGVIKYDAIGNVLWSRIIPAASNGTDEGVDIRFAPDTTIYFLAAKNNLTTGLDFYLEKLSTNGDTIWTSTYSSPGNYVDIPTGLVVFPNSDVAVYGTMDNNPVYRDIHIIKYSSSGSQYWSNTYLNPGGSEIVSDAVIGGTSIYFTGSLFDGVAHYNFLVGAIDSAGVYSWVHSYAGTQNLDDEGYAIAWNASTQEIIATGYSSESGFGNDFITVVFDTAGTFLDTMRVANIGSEISKSILTPTVGAGVYICGNISAISGNGSSNILLIKYCKGPVVSSSSSINACAGDTVQLSASTGFTYNWSPSNSLSSSTDQNPFAFPQYSTQYLVTAANMFGCVSNASQQVIVHPLPVLFITPSSLTLCAGDSVNLFANGATNYSWQPTTFLNDSIGSSVLAWPPNSQTYIITGTDLWGCSAFDSAHINVAQRPSVSFVLPIDTFCIANGLYALTTGSPIGGLYSGSNVNGNIFSASSIGYSNINYTFTDTITGCFSTAQDSFYVDSCLANSVATIQSDSWNYFPNPATDNVTVVFPDGIKTANIQLLDVSGRIVFEEEVNIQHSIVFPLNNIPCGLYYLRIITPEQQLLKKLIIEN